MRIGGRDANQKTKITKCKKQDDKIAIEQSSVTTAADYERAHLIDRSGATRCRRSGTEIEVRGREYKYECASEFFCLHINLNI